jgi:hypothetical protein
MIKPTGSHRRTSSVRAASVLQPIMALLYRPHEGRSSNAEIEQ